MKKTIITLLALAGVAAAEELTLTQPAGGSLSSGNQTLNWSEDIQNLTSWELSFDFIVDSYINNTLLQIGDKDAWQPTVELWNQYIQFNQASNTQVGKVSVVVDELASITLSFIANKTADGDYVGGTYSVTFNQGESTYSASTEITKFTDDRTLSDYSLDKEEARFWTHSSSVTYSNITLTQLDDKLIPEPTTATLSLLALAGLAARRRRK